MNLIASASNTTNIQIASVMLFPGVTMTLFDQPSLTGPHSLELTNFNSSPVVYNLIDYPLDSEQTWQNKVQSMKIEKN
jgi:hypothetical protein